MHRLHLIIAAFIVPCLLSACVEPYDVHVETRQLSVGDAVVQVLIHTSEEDGLTYLNLHDDENTAVAAARFILSKRGGRLVELKHSGERRISFALDGVPYSFDPNRIFTARGVDSTLAAGSDESASSSEGVPGETDAASEAVRAFADSLLAFLDMPALTSVVTVHNNTPGRYSVRSYVSGGELGADARFVHVTADDDPDDFFFVTAESLYTSLRSRGYNVVMQNNTAVTDDGSLSVLCGRRGVAYANVEAEHDHLDVQSDMLEVIGELLAAN